MPKNSLMQCCKVQCCHVHLDYQQGFTLVMVETALVDVDRFLLSADGVTFRYPLIFIVHMVL